MKMQWIVLVCIGAGLAFGACLMAAGMSLPTAIWASVAEAIFCFGLSMLVVGLTPELISRHLDWQINRQKR